MSRRYLPLILAAAFTAFSAASALAVELDAPAFQYVRSGHGKVVVDVTAGASGAPHGFSIYWMTQQDYDDYGNVWPSTLSYPTLHWANFTGAPTLNTWDNPNASFVLAPFQTIRI